MVILQKQPVEKSSFDYVFFGLFFGPVKKSAEPNGKAWAWTLPKQLRKHQQKHWEVQSNYKLKIKNIRSHRWIEN